MKPTFLEETSPPTAVFYLVIFAPSLTLYLVGLPLVTEFTMSSSKPAPSVDSSVKEGLDCPVKNYGTFSVLVSDYRGTGDSSKCKRLLGFP